CAMYEKTPNRLTGTNCIYTRYNWLTIPRPRNGLNVNAADFIIFANTLLQEIFCTDSIWKKSSRKERYENFAVDMLLSLQQMLCTDRVETIAP
ncbi:MAG: hypothetical protein LBT84_02585, partial [Spirochaetia bacterium]|nr:hypothetical protein [Spirochaetia bacterium]